MFNQLLKNALCLSVDELLFLTKAQYNSHVLSPCQLGSVTDC